MASWYFGEIFAHPRIAGLDFYARLDTDSKITSPIRYDLFAFMRNNGFSYGCAPASATPQMATTRCDCVEDLHTCLLLSSSPVGHWIVRR